MSVGQKLESLVPYVVDLELEVDRLRRQNDLIDQKVRETLERIQSLCAADPGSSSAAEPIRMVAQELTALLDDLQSDSVPHPADDRVVAIPIRQLVGQIFSWQQQLVGAQEVSLRLRLEIEEIEWFQGRLRHILDNLISNALRYRDPEKTESWVELAVAASPNNSYQFRLSDNGMGLPAEERHELLKLSYRASPTRSAGLGVGLAAVKRLIEQTGGSLTVESCEDQGATFLMTLPRYPVGDYMS